MKLRIIMILIFYTNLSYADGDFKCFSGNVNPVSLKHLQINEKNKVFFKEIVSTLENETKTAKVKDVNAINTILGCIVQNYNVVTLDTDSFNFIKTKTINPSRVITVMYQPISETRVKVIYDVNTKEELISFYDKTYLFSNSVQYVNSKNKERVITYFGETSSAFEFWIKSFNDVFLVKPDMIAWRRSIYVNANILCIKLDNQTVTHWQNNPTLDFNLWQNAPITDLYD